MFSQDFADHSRVWIYQSNRVLNGYEQEEIVSKGQEFIESWDAHGKSLFADFKVLHDVFIVLVVDEQKAQATGCSIDKSIELIKEIDEQFGIDLFNRFNFAIRKDDQTIPGHLQNDSELLRGNPKVYDNLINNLGTMRKEWLKPVEESWHKQFA
jgi:hypothetical protein